MRKKEYWIGGIIILSIIAFFYLDIFIAKNFINLKNTILDDLFLSITFISSEIIIFFFLTSLFLWKEHKRKWILPLWATLFIRAIVAFILKVLIKRPRPFQKIGLLIPDVLKSNSYLIWNFSFPSFQTMLAFCALPILSKEFPKLKWFWIVFASLVGISRLYFGVHFLSDVLIGGLIGYLIGDLIIKIEGRKKFAEKIYNKFRKQKIRK